MRPGQYIPLPVGRFKGFVLANVPTGSLRWLLANCDGLSEAMQQAIREEIAFRRRTRHSGRARHVQPGGAA